MADILKFILIKTYRKKYPVFCHLSISRWPWQQASPFCNLCYPVLPFNGHEVNAGNTLNFSKLLYLFTAYLNALFSPLSLWGTGHSIDNIIGNNNTSNIIGHIPRHTTGFKWSYSS